jgi:hypothetical protein
MLVAMNLHHPMAIRLEKIAAHCIDRPMIPLKMTLSLPWRISPFSLNNKALCREAVFKRLLHLLLMESHHHRRL